MNSTSVRFLGISELMPVWEPFEDGNEVGSCALEFTNTAQAEAYALTEEEVRKGLEE